jgi:purine-binding chemotaxis protein CheW
MSASIAPLESPLAVCTFWLGDAWFGVDARLVQRVTAAPVRTPIPLAPAVVWGYVNLRGQIHLALDLKICFDTPRQGSAAEQESLIVLRPAVAERLGIVADRIGRIVALLPGEVDPAICNSLALDEQRRRDALTLGVAKLEEGLLTILDPTQLPGLLDRSPPIVAQRPQPSDTL